MSSGKDVLVAENESWELWETEFTRNYQRDLSAYGSDGFTLDGKYRVVFAKSKDNKETMYLAMDRTTGRPVIDWKDPYDFDIKKSILKDWLREECNIVRMAEKRRKVDEE